MVKKGVGQLNYTGLSTDTKPTDDRVLDGETFLEVDTGAVYIFHDGEWYEL